MHPVVIAAIMFLAGAIIGYGLRAILFIVRKNSLELSISERMVHAREAAQKILTDASIKAEALRTELAEIERQKELDLKATEDRLVKRESLLDARQKELDDRMVVLEQKTELVNELKRDAEALLIERSHLIEETAGLSVEDARDAIIAQAQHDYAEDLQVRLYKLETTLHDTIEDRAKDILALSIQRLSSPTANELTTSSVAITDDDIKGKIIGKEGRNIRSFERFAGVELLVDDSPGYIVVSCFDPIRRAIAARALESLIADGRIQPAKIEEEIEKARVAIHDIIKEKGGAAVFECGIYNFDPRLIAILGRLHFRTSYGQNVLQHSIEMAHIAEMLASEIGADPYIAKASALVHDIGKALDHEFEGTHIDIGVKVLRKFGADERVITAMKSHHDDCPHETLEAVIVQTADIISGSRPGARKDTAENYLKRLQELERLAGGFIGVEKAYALQAGREIRIFVHPNNVSDIEAKHLARTIALGIETELRYPGQIKVTIIREMRVIDYAR